MRQDERSSTPACAYLKSDVYEDARPLQIENPHHSFLEPGVCLLSMYTMPLCALAMNTACSNPTLHRAGIFDGFVNWLKNLGTMGTPASEPSPNQVDEFEPKGSILVVGSTGKLGRLIVGELLERGYEVLALVSSEERAEEVRVYFTRLCTVQVRRLCLSGDLPGRSAQY
jgi:hypothetical protein